MFSYTVTRGVRYRTSTDAEVSMQLVGNLITASCQLCGVECSDVSGKARSSWALYTVLRTTQATSSEEVSDGIVQEGIEKVPARSHGDQIGSALKYEHHVDYFISVE